MADGAAVATVVSFRVSTMPSPEVSQSLFGFDAAHGDGEQKVQRERSLWAHERQYGHQSRGSNHREARDMSGRASAW